MVITFLTSNPFILPSSFFALMTDVCHFAKREISYKKHSIFYSKQGLHRVQSLFYKLLKFNNLRFCMHAYLHA